MMSAGGPLRWVGEAREKKILEICDSHIKKVVNTVVGMNKAIQGFCDMNMKKVDEGFQEAFKSERAADEVKREILEELSKGIFHPIHRDEIIRLTMTADEIAANAKAATRKLRYLDPKKLHEKLRETIRKFSVDLVAISNRTYEAFVTLGKDSKTAVALSQDVERLEEKIDDLRAEELTPELLIWYKKIKDIGPSIVLKEMTDNMENVADFCEDVSDIIRSIAVSYM
jgi:predicted phosphate transport protein (TIGR00153 family)